MKHSSIRLRDRITAEALSYGSMVAREVPKVAEVMGQAPGVRWMFMRGTPASMVTAWQDFPGIRGSGKIPGQYHGAVLTTFDKSVFDEHQRELKGRAAAAYIVGETAVMAGFSDERDIFGKDPETSDRYAVVMRVGGSVLRRAIGIALPNSHKFIAPHDLEIVSQPISLSEVGDIPIL